MGTVGLVLGVGVLVFSEMKSVYPWAFLFVLFFGRGAWGFFRPKKRRESFSPREECAILTPVKRDRRLGNKSGSTHNRAQDSRRSFACFIGVDRNRTRRIKRNLMIESQSRRIIGMGFSFAASVRALRSPVKRARKTRAFCGGFSPTKAISISWVPCIF